MCKKPLNPNSRTAGRIDSRFFASASSLKIRALWVSFPIIERSEQGKWVNFHFEYVGLGLGLEKGLSVGTLNGRISVVSRPIFKFLGSLERE